MKAFYKIEDKWIFLVLGFVVGFLFAPFIYEFFTIAALEQDQKVNIFISLITGSLGFSLIWYRIKVSSEEHFGRISHDKEMREKDFLASHRGILMNFYSEIITNIAAIKDNELDKLKFDYSGTKCNVAPVLEYSRDKYWKINKLILALQDIERNKQVTQEHVDALNEGKLHVAKYFNELRGIKM